MSYPTDIPDIVYPNKFAIVNIVIPIAVHEQRVIVGHVGGSRETTITFPFGKRISY